MTLDSYSVNDKQARCAQCGKFMPWERSRVVEKGDGFPVPSPVYVEVGLCRKCYCDHEVFMLGSSVQ